MDACHFKDISSSIIIKLPLSNAKLTVFFSLFFSLFCRFVLVMNRSFLVCPLINTCLRITPWTMVWLTRETSASAEMVSERWMTAYLIALLLIISWFKSVIYGPSWKTKGMHILPLHRFIYSYKFTMQQVIMNQTGQYILIWEYQCYILSPIEIYHFGYYTNMI